MFKKSLEKLNTRVFPRDNIDTDIIIPASFLNTFDTDELARHAMEPLEKNFKENAEKVLVVGKNFGCGSSREHAVWALDGCGVEIIIAESFARIFFKNAVNFGVLPITLENASNLVQDGEQIDIDLDKNQIQCEKGTFSFSPLPSFIADIANAGGLVPYAASGL